MLTHRIIMGAGALALLGGAWACTQERAAVDPAAAIAGPGSAQPSFGLGAGEGVRPERLARRVARALRNPAFRAYVRAQLDHSPYREHKLQFQSFLRANGRRALGSLAAENGESETGVAADADSSSELEFYLPVQAHRAAWNGDENILVATAQQDGDVPVAFDTRGRRLLLDPRRPPVTPVLAIVPVETDFSIAPSGVMACLEPEGCAGGGGGGAGGSGGGGAPAVAHGLFMTQLHIVDNYEGWLKGDPEYEVHVLGQVGQTIEMTTLQCAGEHAGGPYYFDQDSHDYTQGTPVLLFSQTQFDSYRVQHPGQSIRLLFIEDDDTACKIVMDSERAAAFVAALTAAYGVWTAGTDSTVIGTILRTYARARSLLSVWDASRSLIKTNDELIGNAIEDTIVNELYPGYNWVIKGENTTTTGWVKLEMR